MIPKGHKKIQEGCGHAGIHVLKAHWSFGHPDENIMNQSCPDLYPILMEVTQGCRRCSSGKNPNLWLLLCLMLLNLLCCCHHAWAHPQRMGMANEGQLWSWDSGQPDLKLNWIKWAICPSSETPHKAHMETHQAWVTTGIEEAERRNNWRNKLIFFLFHLSHSSDKFKAWVWSSATQAHVLCHISLKSRVN